MLLAHPLKSLASDLLSEKPEWMQVFEGDYTLKRIAQYLFLGARQFARIAALGQVFKKNHILITKYLSLQEIKKCRLLNWQMNKFMLSALESSGDYCFVVNPTLKANLREGFRIHFKMMRLRNITKIDELQKMLAMKKMDSTNINELQMVDCVISWMDTLQVIYNFKNLHSLKIVARSERFLALEGSDETKWNLFRISDANVLQDLPLRNQSKRKLSKFVHESHFIHYSAVLLRTLLLLYSEFEELSVSIGSHENIQTDFRSIPHLFSSLASCLKKSSSTLKKLAVEMYPSLNGVEKNQRMFFNEFTRSIVPMIETLHAITEMSLNFPNLNCEVDENRNCLKSILSKLTTLRNISIGQIKMKLSTEGLILTIVPPEVNCKHSVIYLFENSPENIVVNNQSYSDATFVIPGVLENTPQNTPLKNFKNYHPLECINFKKTMIYEALPFMSKLHVDQNEQIINKNLMLHIQDKEMQLIIDRGASLKSLSLKCNLSLLTDSGLTGLSRSICEKILLEAKENANPEKRTLNDQAILGRPKSKAGLGISLASLTKLETLLLHDAGENVTDTFALILCQMSTLKSISVTSPSLTQFGLDTIASKSKLAGENRAVVWHCLKNFPF